MTRQKLLDRWTSALRRLQHEHELSSRFYEKLSWKLGIPAVIFSAAAGAVIVLAKSAGIDQAPLLAAILSFLAAGFCGVQTFLNCAQRSLTHKVAAAKFGELVTQSELACVQQIDDAGCDELLADIRSKWNSTHADAPNLRASITKDINASLGSRSDERNA
jgi:hypothetical protein